MQTDGKRLSRLLAHALLTALLAATSLVSHAQQTPDDFYRAEFVILERITDPDAVNEAARTAPSGPAAHRAALIEEHGEALASVDWGQVRLRDKVIFLNRR